MNYILTGCCCFFLFTPLTSTGEPACIPGSFVLGDVDGNGDIALLDYSAFASCLSGPNATPNPKSPLSEAECLSVFDTNGDSHIDIVDFARLLLLYTGECTGLGDCPTGMHIVHISGEIGIVNQDTADVLPPDSREYRCVQDESCDGVNCNDSGACKIYSGKAVCACDQGRAGEFCERCSVGYQLSRNGVCELGSECRERYCSGQGTCLDRAGEIVCICDDDASGDHCENGGGDPSILSPPTWIKVKGTELSIEQGEQRQICSTLFGGGLIDTQLDWELVGPGSLFFQEDNCYTYIAPPPGSFTDTQVVEIQICSNGFPDQCASRFLTVDPPGGIKSTGQAHSILKPFDDNIKRFMRYRCIGGAILGISIFGKPVYVRGYGNLSGAPTNDPEYLKACGDTFDVSDAVEGFILPNPKEVQPNTPFRIGSNSKAVTAAILRKAVKEHILASDTDDNVEALRLCDGIVPPELHDIMCQGGPPPHPLPSISGLAPDCDSSNPCPYSGNCVVTNETTGTGYCDNCLPGYGGLDCSANLSFCPSLPNHADSRWEDVTLGHLMGHRSGLPRSVPSRDNVILPNLYKFRSLMIESDWQDQEDLLTSEAGFPSGTFNAEFPDYVNAKNDIGTSAYLVPRPTVVEAVLARLGACLLFSPGGTIPIGLNSYSNTGYALLGVVVEYITGTPFGGDNGKPNLHSGSLLEDFNQDQLGVPIPGQGTSEGMYITQSVFDLRNSKEPIWRGWSTTAGGTYYKLVNDEKRPFCEWSLSNDCNFLDWINQTLQFDWNFLNKKTIAGYHGGSFNGPPTAGNLVVEAEVFLRFMAKYWVGGDGNNPLYGETRCPNGQCIWTKLTSHIGALAGGYSDVKQLGGTIAINNTTCQQDLDCPAYTACNNSDEDEVVQQFCLGGKCHKRNEYTTPPINNNGIITDDFGQSECHSCRLPVGVDIFVAFNQQDDKKCVEASKLDKSDPGYYTCSSAYNAVGGFLGDAVCKVQWPVNPFQLWPPAIHEGGSTMSPTITTP